MPHSQGEHFHVAGPQFCQRWGLHQALARAQMETQRRDAKKVEAELVEC